ncbi:hypothetical protein [Streptomyces sp. NPDC053079]|uniref:hypothetical protein n=1 Tax=Streptomyces sp. NPDC053079 TaxID=3365697 RepID=UPI0037D19A30
MTGAGVRNVILEAEGVLFQSSGSLTGELADVPARQVFQSATWLRYAAGQLTSEEAFERIATALGVHPSAIAEAVIAHRSTWRPSPQLADMLDTLTSQGTNLYCLAAMPAADWNCVREQLPDLWARFVDVATTGELGAEPASLDAVTRLCSRWAIAPRDTVYLGADQHTLQFTRSMGIRSVRYRTPADLWRLRSEKNRLKAAEDYIRHSLRTDDVRSEAVTETGEHHPVDETWSLFYLLDASETIARSEPGRALLRQLASLEQDGLYGFLRSPHPLMKDLPIDSDDTGLALSTLYSYGLADQPMLQRAAKRILDNVNRDGLIQLYFHPERPRVDSVVCSSALCLLYLAGYQEAPAARRTEDFLYALLENRGYEQGSLYTPSPDFFLYTLFRIARRSAGFCDRFGTLLAARLTERIGTTGEPAGQALRVLMCRTLRIPNDIDYERLLSQQCIDGSWGPAPAWQLIATAGNGYNRVLDTTFAAQAIRLTLAIGEDQHRPQRNREIESHLACPAELSGRAAL